MKKFLAILCLCLFGISASGCFSIKLIDVSVDDKTAGEVELKVGDEADGETDKDKDKDD